ncbi:MAG TPA: regulatory iron-sulfur-containing complex subunit RicT, partial [Kofleriaceae bacterium]|nr:regulatory iron-sulfur-containing complex subunit RicT [Kofleriaceae bacterium]
RGSRDGRGADAGTTTERTAERGADRGAERATDRSTERAAKREPALAAGSPSLLRSSPPLGRAAEWDAEDDDAPTADAKGDWGKEDDSPAPPVALEPSFPEEAEDLDPATAELDQLPELRGARGDVQSVVGVRFGQAGRVSLFDGGASSYAVGDMVLVDADRGPRLGTVVVASERRQSNDRGLRRVLRAATEADLLREPPTAERSRAVLRLAKDRTAALDLPAKVFRAEVSGGGRNERIVLYLTTEERIELRELIRDLSNATGARVELRQLGARDEAKAIGGIGSCGLTLCCTTWLPEFVPVSIKMAKDQGLVLNPTKVAGQCGRLKCCLVYEQAGYAELRKGLPKLGKRVVTTRGEGRVVEVDVLRQRVRVSYGPGESEVLPATEMRPLFPSGNAPAEDAAGGRPGAEGSQPSGRASPGADERAEPDDPSSSGEELEDEETSNPGGPSRRADAPTGEELAGELDDSPSPDTDPGLS